MLACDTSWRLVDPQRFISLPLADGRILYDRLAGRTHVLNLCADEVFQAIEMQARTPREITSIISAGALNAALEQDRGLLDDVREILDGFRRIELAEPALR